MSAHSRRAKRQRAHMREVRKKGFALYERRVKKLTASGRLDKLKVSGFVRRKRQ